MKNSEGLIKILLSILFILCLLKLPYGYYEFVRFIALIAFGYLAYQSYRKNNKTSTIIYAALALLFQPFFKIALGRDLWNIVDVMVAVGLIGSLLMNKQKNKNVTSRTK